MKKQIQWAIKQVRQVLRFIHHELWEVELNKLPFPRRFLVRLLRTGHLVIRGIKQDNIPQHAAALTLGTLISIVPILAISLSMYKGLGADEEAIEQTLMEQIEEMPAEFQEFIMQMFEQYAEVNVAALGGIFLFFVLVIVIKMLGSIEESFNRVWYISDSRNILRRVSNYISVLVIVPILVVVAGAGSTLVDTFMQERLESVAWIWRSLLKVGPLISVWLAFSFLYIFVPNTRVRLGPGLVSGFVGALLWLTWQTVYIEFQMGVSKYNAIYGTFASVPIFLAWLHISWVIVLLGAEVAFALQNSETYKLERTASDASTQSKLMIAMGIMQQAAQAITGDRHSFSSDDFARETRVSIRLVNDVVRLFERAGLLGALADQPSCYVLLKSPEQLTVKRVVDTVLQDGTGPLDLGLDHLDEAVQQVVRRFNTGLEQQMDSMTVMDLVGTT